MLTLSFADISVTFDKFLNSEYPRTLIQQATLEFSTLGTAALGGSYYREKYLWNIGAFCDQEQRNALEAIFHEFSVARRALTDSDILVYDKTAVIVERSPRTRDIVPSTLERMIGLNHVAYYPVCKAVITETPKFNYLGFNDSVTMVLTETIAVPNA